MCSPPSGGRPGLCFEVARAQALDRLVPAGWAQWFFADEAAVSGLMVGAGLRPLHVQLVPQRRGMPDEAALESWLRSQVLPGYGRGDEASDPMARAAFEAEAVRRCVAGLRREDGSFDQRYGAWTPRQLPGERAERGSHDSTPLAWRATGRRTPRPSRRPSRRALQEAP